MVLDLVFVCTIFDDELLHPCSDFGSLLKLYSLVPRGSYPTPFVGHLVLWLGSVILKNRRPKKGVGYEPLGRVEGLPRPPTTLDCSPQINS